MCQGYEFGVSECWEYKELAEKVDEAKNYLQRILQVVFVNGSVDEDFFEDIEMLCHELNVKLPKDLNFKIEKKNETLKSLQFLLGATV